MFLFLKHILTNDFECAKKKLSVHFEFIECSKTYSFLLFLLRLLLFFLFMYKRFYCFNTQKKRNLNVYGTIIIVYSETVRFSTFCVHKNIFGKSSNLTSLLMYTHIRIDYVNNVVKENEETAAIHQKFQTWKRRRCFFSKWHRINYICV